MRARTKQSRPRLNGAKRSNARKAGSRRKMHFQKARWGDKAAFVRAHAPSVSGPEIVDRARQKGLNLSLAYVHNIRSAAKKEAQQRIRERGAGITRRPPEKLEQDFKKLAFVLGVERSKRLLSRLRESLES